MGLRNMCLCSEIYRKVKVWSIQLDRVGNLIDSDGYTFGECWIMVGG